jgi:hypothetical protein
MAATAAAAAAHRLRRIGADSSNDRRVQENGIIICRSIYNLRARDPIPRVVDKLSRSTYLKWSNSWMRERTIILFICFVNHNEEGMRVTRLK